MHLNDDNIIDIGSALDVCPSCKSDNWKSARMIVLEGTSFTAGEISGDINDPGSFSGSLKAFLLSDRWFSWNYKLEGDIKLNTNSGLVEVVKRFMVAQGSMISMPSIPFEPKKIGIFERIRPIEPKLPIEPTIPQKPQDKPWYTHFLREFLLSLFFLFIFFVIVEKTGRDISSSLVLLGAAFIVLYSLIRSFFGNKRARKNYEYNMTEYQKELDKLKAKTDKYHLDYQNYLKQTEDAKLQQDKYDQAIANYNEDLSVYEREKNKVMIARELLWEKARVCTRCGTAYLGVKA